MDTSTPGRKVLIVEDNPEFAALMARLLELNGLTTATASNGRSAVSHLRDNRVDLLILDFRLPDMNGFEVLSRLEAEKLGTPFVVVTGLGDQQIAVQLMKRGALDYLVKDESLLDMLPSVVVQALDRLDRDRRLAEAEDKLRDQNAFFQTVLDALSHPLYVIDTATGHVAMANRVARETGRTAFSLARSERPAPPADAEVTDSPVEEVARTKRPLIVEHVQYKDEATNVYEIHIYPIFDAAGEVRQVVEYELNVTTRKQAEQALRDSEARLRQVVESLPIILLSRDVVTRKMVLLIGAVEDMLGYEPQAFFDDPDLLIRLIDPEDFERVRAQVVASIEAGTAFTPEFRIVHGLSNEKVWVRAQGTPIIDEEGTLLRLDCVLVDITAERKVAQEREAWSHRLQ
ncbi:MAG: response regulator, partial [Rhodospirillales bacterium]|nr:response regulator [Rhodospirillales bacterium]